MAMSQSSMAFTPRSAVNTPTDSPYDNSWRISSENTAYDATTLATSTFMTTHDDFMTKLFRATIYKLDSYSKI